MLAFYKDDDQGYGAWLRDNPGGYVYNDFGGLDPRYKVLHRADCSILRNVRPRQKTTSVAKVCSSDLHGLVNWLTENRGPEGVGYCPCSNCLKSQVVSPRGGSTTPAARDVLTGHLKVEEKGLMSEAGAASETDALGQLAKAIRQKNVLDAEIARIIDRPALIGHVGEYIAAHVFGIKLEQSASRKSLDGHFKDGSLQGKTVDIKWYGKMEGLLDISPDSPPDFYLVMAGPKSPAVSSRGATRPWLITCVYVFDAARLIRALKDRGVKIGVATSVQRELWEAAEIYPAQRNSQLVLSDQQRKQLALFE